MTRVWARRWLVFAVAAVVATLVTVPAAQADPAPGCPRAAVFAVAGTRETDEAADPQRSVGLLAGVTYPLVARWANDPGAVTVTYIPYPASYDRPVFYLFSELRGADRLAREANDTAARCPDTKIVLLGFSQGADVVSDVVHRAANHSIPLAPGRITAAYMLGSPRRDPNAPNMTDVPGRGVLGPRPTRELDVYDGRVVEICAPGDPICSTETFNVVTFQEGWASGAHRSYPTLYGPGGVPLYTVLAHSLDTIVAGGQPASVALAAGG